jgi:hypothetical protein
VPLGSDLCAYATTNKSCGGQARILRPNLAPLSPLTTPHCRIWRIRAYHPSTCTHGAVEAWRSGEPPRPTAFPVLSRPRARRLLHLFVRAVLTSGTQGLDGPFGTYYASRRASERDFRAFCFGSRSFAFFRPVCALRWTERAMAVHVLDAGGVHGMKSKIMRSKGQRRAS